MRTITLNITKSYCSSKPDDVGIINNQLLVGQSEISLEELRGKVTKGASFTPSYINDPILNHDGTVFRVSRNEFDEHKNNVGSIPYLTDHNVKEEEIDKEIIRRKDICWSQQSLFALDFDNKTKETQLSFKQAVERAENLGLFEFFMYRTFSSTRQQEKFRMVFQVAEPITDYRTAYAIQQALMKVFPECDKNCAKLTWIFFGTNKSSDRFNPDRFLDVKRLFEVVHIGFKEKDKANYSRSVNRYCQECNLLVHNGIALVTNNHDMVAALNKNPGYIDKWNGLSFVYTATEFEAKYDLKGTVPEDIGEEASSPEAKTDPKKEYKFAFHREFDFGKLEDRCQLARSFSEGKEHITHADLIRIMTNLIHTEGGQKYFLDNFTKSVHLYKTKDKCKKMKYQMEYFKAHEYSPYNCDREEDSCSYSSGCCHGKNMLGQVIARKKGIIALKNVSDGKLPSIDEAFDNLKILIARAYEGTPGIHIFKAPTGIGKTEIYIDLAQPGDIIVTPTHDLNGEIARRLQEKGKKCIVAIERPDLAEKEEQEKFEALMKVGDVNRASGFYAVRVKDYMNIKTPSPSQAACINFIKQQEELKHTNEIILATHAKLSAIKANPQTVFIDEDFMYTNLISMANISIKDIEMVLQYINIERNSVADKEEILEQLHVWVNQYLSEIKEKISQKAPVITLELPLKRRQLERLSEIISSKSFAFSSKIFSLFAPGYRGTLEDDYLSMGQSIILVPRYIKDKCSSLTIVKMDKELLSAPDTNYIILSATANRDLWTKVFPNVDFHEIKAKSLGEMRLFAGESLSRANINKHIEGTYYLDYAKNVVEIEKIVVITFKIMKSKLKKYGFTNIDEQLHFGKVTGIDNLKGKDIAIIGTPHLNAHAYLCKAAALGIECNEQTMQSQEIERNGFRFYFHIFKSPGLREIQLHCIEAELIQATGRARSYRTGATVYIFSNFPIPGVRVMG